MIDLMQGIWALSGMPLLVTWSFQVHDRMRELLVKNNLEARVAY